MPEFETDEAHDYFVTRFYIHEGFRADIEKENGNFAHKNERSLSEVLSHMDYEKVRGITKVVKEVCGGWLYVEGVLTRDDLFNPMRRQ